MNWKGWAIKMVYAADFETTTDINDCRVWAWATSEVGNENNVSHGTSIESLFDFCKSKKRLVTLYFHNLKFDGEFVLHWLLSNGFTHVKDGKGMGCGEFTTLISDMGQFYSIEIALYQHKGKAIRVKLLDSLKVLPFSVEEIAKAFNLPLQKLEIDYKAYRPVGHKLTGDELAYIYNDVKIVSMALDILFKQGLTRMTTGSNAMADFKSIMGESRFRAVLSAA